MQTIHISGGPPGPRTNLLVFLPGTMLVGLGLTILWMPELLRYLAAALFLSIGGILLGAAWQMRRAPARSSVRWFTAFNERLRMFRS